MASLFHNQKRVIENFLTSLETFFGEQTTRIDQTNKVNINAMHSAVKAIKANLPTTDIDTSHVNIEAHLEKLTVYRHLLFGYLYLIQHILESILVNNTESISANDMDALKGYYDTLDTFRKGILGDPDVSEPGISAASSGETLEMLLRYLSFFKTKLDPEMQAFLDKGSYDQQDIDVLKGLLIQLTDKPSNQEMLEYKNYFEKLGNISGIISNLLAVQGKITYDNIQEVKIFNDTSKLKTMVDKIFDTNATNPPNVQHGPDIIAWMNRIVGNASLQPMEQPNKADVLAKKDAIGLLDPFYYSLVDLYETVSGAVRVYIRTKDIVEGVPVVPVTDKNTGTETSNGIFKDYDTNKMKLSIPGQPLETFGPFYKVVPTGTTNKELITKDYINMKNFVVMFDKAKTNGTQLSLVFFTYGHSGSGKTFTLFNKDPLNPENQGVLYMMQSIFEERGYKMEFNDYCKVYGYLQGDTFLPEQKVVHSEPEKKMSYASDVDAFVKEQIDVSVLPKTQSFNEDEFVQSLSIDSFIKPTPNNPQSSRGFMVVWFDVSYNGVKAGKIGFVDMAGNEDPYDLLVKLSPTLQWPTAGKKSFLQLEQSGINYGTIDLVCNLLQQQVLTYVKSTVEFMTRIFRLLHTKADKISMEKSLSNMLRMFHESYIDSATSYSLTTATQENIKLVKELNETNSKSVCRAVSQMLTYFDKDDSWMQQALLSRQIKDVKILRKKSKDFNDYSSYNNAVDIFKKCQDVKANDIFFHVGSVSNTSEGVNKYVKISASVLTNDSKLTTKLVKYAIKKELEGLEKDQGKITTLNTYIKETLSQIRSFVHGEGNTSVDSLKTVIQLCDTILYVLINEKKDSSDKTRSTEIMNTLKYASLVKYMVGLDGKDAKLVAQQVYDQNLDILFKIDKSLDLTVREEDIQSILTPLFVQGIKDVKLRTNPQEDFKRNVNRVYDECIRFMRTYFSTVRRNVIINKKEYPFSQDYLLRIIQEGFFINQANAELVEFLRKKKEGEVLTYTEKCVLDKAQFYFEVYDKFKDLSNVPGKACQTYTGLVPILQDVFEKDATAKYIMLCNVRREEDIKYRTGAIDTLRLVEKLKST